MIILLSGTINVGKTTCAALLAQHLRPAHVVEVDGFFRNFPEEDWVNVAQRCLRLATEKAVRDVRSGFSVIIPYPLWRDDLELVLQRLRSVPVDVHFITLTAPQDEILGTRSKRSDSTWERDVLDWHVRLGVTNPDRGVRINTAGRTPQEVARAAVEAIQFGEALVQQAPVRTTAAPSFA